MTTDPKHQTEPNASRHTPGPWGLRQSKSSKRKALLVTASRDGGATFGGHLVTSLRDPSVYAGRKNFSPEEHRANARLIAAAPELLEALYYLLEQTIDQDLQYGIALSEGEEDARAKALAVIAKATGLAA